MKLLSLFSGIGAFEKALKRIGKDVELVNYCEIDKYASKSYSMIHKVDESKNLGDITEIDTSQLPTDIDLITYGFPCQDISIAGKQKGFEHDNKLTRSGLFFEALRIIEDTKPKIAIAENVKNLTGKKFKKEFEIVLKSLENAGGGYNNYWKVLNAKDFNVPQNRERVFIVSIRKDIDTGNFIFPKPRELHLKLKDLLEDEVDEKYYLTDKMIQYISANNKKWTGNNSKSLVNKTIASTINTGEGSRRCDASNYIIPSIPEENIDLKVADFRYDEGIRVRKNGFSPTLTSKAGGGGLSGQPLIISSTQKNATINSDGISPCLTSSMGTGGGHIPMHTYDVAIRKITPKESFRLMGFDDEDFEKIEGISNTQLYKQAGNSIVVNVLEAIFKELFTALKI